MSVTKPKLEWASDRLDRWHRIGNLDATKKAAELLAKRDVSEILAGDEHVSAQTWQGRPRIVRAKRPPAHESLILIGRPIGDSGIPWHIRFDISEREYFDNASVTPSFCR
jgi:hypothetical protein